MSTALRNHPKSCINRFNASVQANWTGATGTGRSRHEIPWDGGRQSYDVHLPLRNIIRPMA